MGAGFKLRVLDMARAARAKGPQSQEKLKRAYGKLLNSTTAEWWDSGRWRPLSARAALFSL